MKEIVKEVSKIVRKNHLTYNQTKYLFREVRKECELESEIIETGAKEHLTQEEVNALLNFAYKSKGVTGVMLKILLFSGARVNEFVNIKIKDIYLDERKIYLSKTKNRKPRYVPIFDFYLDELKLYLSQLNRVNGYLFESTRHTKYSTRRIQQIVKRFVKKANIEKHITPHRLRATIAVWLKEKDVPEELIQKFLGHAKLETTQIYTKGAIMDLQKINQKLIGE